MDEADRAVLEAVVAQMRGRRDELAATIAALEAVLGTEHPLAPTRVVVSSPAEILGAMGWDRPPTAPAAEPSPEVREVVAAAKARTDAMAAEKVAAVARGNHRGRHMFRGGVCQREGCGAKGSYGLPPATHGNDGPSAYVGQPGRLTSPVSAPPPAPVRRRPDYSKPPVPPPGEPLLCTMPGCRGTLVHREGDVASMFRCTECGSPRSPERPIRARPRADALPEHIEWHDTGCDVAPSCLACPLRRCKFDFPRQGRRHPDPARAVEAQRLVEVEALPVGEVAERLGVSMRTVFRDLGVQRGSSRDILRAGGQGKDR